MALSLAIFEHVQAAETQINVNLPPRMFRNEFPETLLSIGFGLSSSIATLNRKIFFAKSTTPEVDIVKNEKYLGVLEILKLLNYSLH